MIPSTSFSQDAKEQLLVEQEASEERLERVLLKLRKTEEDLEFCKTEKQSIQNELSEFRAAAAEELQDVEKDLDAAILSRNEAWSECESLREEARQAMRKAKESVTAKEAEHARALLDFEKDIVHCP